MSDSFRKLPSRDSATMALSINRSDTDDNTPSQPPSTINKRSTVFKIAQGAPVKRKVTELDFMETEKLESQKFSSSTKFFLKHSYRDLKRRKFHYCLAFCSVFIVVIFALVINTIVARGPIIFLKMAEGNQGEIDGVVTSSSFTGDSSGFFLNYTRVEELYQNQYNLSPRKQFCGLGMGSEHTHDYLDPDDKEQMDQWKSHYDQQTQLPSRSQVYDTNLKMKFKGCLMLWDTQRERDIELGRLYKHDPLEYGECNINEKLQSTLGINEGDTVYFSIQMGKLWNAVSIKYNEYATQNNKQKLSYIGSGTTKIPCKAKRLTSGTSGKYPNSDVAGQQSMEYGQFLQLLANYLPSDLDSNKDFKQYLQDPNLVSLNEFADMFVMTLPSPRVFYYENSDYDEIQRGVAGYANQVTDALGFFPITISLNILKEMENYSTAVLFLGLIFDIIILLFVIISVLLIYSLLMISVETKTFEIGVMRMIGLSKHGLILMIFIQGVMYVFPAIFLGFMLCFPAIRGLYQILFVKDLGINLKPVPDGLAVVQALIIGLVIPFLSSIIPIQKVLTKNLNEALDYQRSKTQAIYVQILQKNSSNLSSYIVFGIISIIYGLAIYYFLPLAMLSLNFKLILRIFFFILLGMLFGLSLLAFNVQRILEILLTHCILFWEKPSMKMMVLKNLTAHKMRNKMTSIIYSLALGFIIFLIVSYNLQIESSNLITLKRRGGYLRLSSETGHYLTPSLIDPILQKHSPKIESFAYVTFDLARIPTTEVTKIVMSDKSRINELKVGVYGVTPSIFDATLDQFLKEGYMDSKSGLKQAEQLYTARGTQGVGVGSIVTRKTSTDPSLFNETIMLSFYGQTKNIYYQMRPIFTNDQSPAFTMTNRDLTSSSSKHTVLVSLPMAARYTGAVLDDVPYERLIIKMKDHKNKQDVDAFLKDVRAKLSADQDANIRTWSALENEETFSQVKMILNIIFTVVIAITMFLCFFSLSSSMSANLYEQTKEIGILRAMGFKRIRITMLYVYEAFILVFASSMLGIIIGTIVGFTMTLQQVLFTEIPLIFYFPWQQFLMILGITIICAFASTYGPTRTLTRKPISEIFRMN